jgi:hypothetical protein
MEKLRQNHLLADEAASQPARTALGGPHGACSGRKIHMIFVFGIEFAILSFAG